MVQCYTCFQIVTYWSRLGYLSVCLCLCVCVCVCTVNTVGRVTFTINTICLKYFISPEEVNIQMQFCQRVIGKITVTTCFYYHHLL